MVNRRTGSNTHYVVFWAIGVSDASDSNHGTDLNDFMDATLELRR